MTPDSKLHRCRGRHDLEAADNPPYDLIIFDCDGVLVDSERITNTVVDYAFERLGAGALFAGHNPANEASRRLLMKLGFAYTHDAHYPPTGLLHPSYLLTA